ncbi:hypothetical protein J2Y69_002228 [Microbacterium resistens]|uniref:Uncharacterized protein n=1 Tax=Microbacterium resistens TaxID=156977 RepID=A0ABU1SDF9_9MICO|nr:hypothetical protein [Microbacterium resistens]MDR6867624.1 hypothetical protein [Microbacterium resistens]
MPAIDLTPTSPLPLPLHTAPSTSLHADLAGTTMDRHDRAAAPGEQEHEHAWLTESRHRTSQGELLYVRCTACSARRVDLLPSSGLPPTAASRVIGGSPTS